MSIHWGGRGISGRWLIAGSGGTGPVGGGTLGTLALTGLSSPFVIGVPASGTITGATPGSTLSASGLPTGFTINSAARTWAYDGTVF